MPFKGAKGQGKCHAPRYGNAPRALQNRAKYRRRCRSAPNYRVYGPPKRRERFLLDLKLLRSKCPELVQDVEKKQKEKEQDEKKARIAEREAEELPQMTVKKVNFHVQGRCARGGNPEVAGNAVKHHTDRYARCLGDDPQPVLRRGQEFKVTITFDRPYNPEQDDLILYVEADEDNPGKNLSANFKLDEERSQPYTEGQHWAARIIKKLPHKKAMKLAVYIPGRAAVGEWDLKVKTRLRDQEMTCVYEHPDSFVVLFNPWSKQDQVYYTGDQRDLDEYVLNEESLAYYGTAKNIRCSDWRYGQFDEKVLEISLAILRKAFNSKMTSAMGDPQTVSRALTKIVNSIGDDGVLVGNWSGDYEGGCSPTKWMSSANILKQYHDEGEPVKFGQCWVFSHVLTAVCRALGLPCRSVTNFDSAHDTDSSCSIDFYYNEDGSENQLMKKDSIWNFHVWNEVWILRPDIEEVDCNGWHSIDATPQETSDGSYQCGPSPVAAIKRGLTHLGFDTPFIFAEVNADVVHWMAGKDGEWECSALKKASVGHGISTKCPNKDERLDLTLDYKFPEGSEEERCAAKRAVRLSGKDKDIYTQSANIEVSFGDDPKARIGDDLDMCILVRNLSNVKRVVDLLMTARTSSYWNNSDSDKEVCKETRPSLAIGPGSTEKVPFKVPAKSYMDKQKSVRCLYEYVRCTDKENNMPYTAQEPFQLSPPDLIIKEDNIKSKPGQCITVIATFTNPLDSPLTHCEVLTEGDLVPHGKDKTDFLCYFGMYSKKLKEDIPAKKTVNLEVHLCWEEEKKEKDDDSDSDDGDCAEASVAPTSRTPKKTKKVQKLEFFCDQMESLCAKFTTVCVRP